MSKPEQGAPGATAPAAHGSDSDAGVAAVFGREIVASGCQQMIGYRPAYLEDGTCEVLLDLEARHLNRAGVLHGGIVATLLDVASGVTAGASFDPDAPTDVVTISLTLNYIASGTAGDQVRARAQVTGGGRSTLHVAGELRSGGGRLLATSVGVFRRIGPRQDSATRP